MTVLLASLAAAASLWRSTGRSREAAAYMRAWLRFSMAALRCLFSRNRTSGMAKNAAAYACEPAPLLNESQEICHACKL